MKLMELILDGYDHIVDLDTDENVVDAVTKKGGQLEILSVLKKLPEFEVHGSMID